MRTVIIGGVAGGMSAATRLRRLDEQMEIVILEKGPYVSFANCGLPYYVSGEISQREDLLVQTPEKLKARFNLDVRPYSEATEIDGKEKVVTVQDANGVYELSYDKLILSPGAKPFIPPFEGIDEAKNVFTLRNVPDVDKIMTSLEKDKPKKAVVIGAGFIGLEMAENLAKVGIEVTIIEMAPHVLPTVDYEMAAFITNELQANGLKVLTGKSVVAFKEEGKKLVLDSGEEIETDLVILSVGVRPENELAQTAGVELGMRGGILVDDSYETSVKDIYAVGDAIIVTNQITKEDTMIALASPANRQGRQVADVIAGMKRINKGSIGTAIVRVFNQSIASTGLTERQLNQLGYDFHVIHIDGKNHAGYYPGASTILLKLLFNPTTGEIYGAQGVGADGVDKRIDILATAIKGNLTVEDLPELELTYAPPFGSAKDVVNMAGYTALNIMENVAENIQLHEVDEAQKQGAYLVDVRTKDEFSRGSIPGFINLPLNELRSRMSELPKDKEIILSCHSGQRSYIAQRMLLQHGFKVKNLDGSYLLYQAVNG
ncbi:FAD-dependent oxidoreductase [Vagococcus carniphilus]|uniref:FAD-dependent oxidoreductase n=1 Tax=Vagococcus carniphilus TaxID=218144 RepID=UPI00288DBE0E|nr:FAD-dependent oxidoreductase [Vagococcus carniphilus]MDT2831857.1 FAD-dependent oxidoreductase [Vagococcus carniphilus]MDT2839335.1 FAD-dependent oxidoreductase [Vagococcus carniphilus]MDT2855367.1 FAD-dependent oxidoreductase [Vagococcus carniphilus]